MSSSLIARLRLTLQNVDNMISLMFGRRFPPESFCLAGIQESKPTQQKTKPFSLKELLGDGILWAVPKHRRSIEKRLKRKFGDPYYVQKLLQPKTHIRTCNTCGDDHEAGVLCPTCYKKVMDETKLMQEQIQNELKLDPVEKDVVVLYSGENETDEIWEGKRVVEMKKERPSWFSKNLLQQSTQKPADTKDVKPSNLG